MIEYIFDTNALRAISFSELEELKSKGIKLIASPYSAFEAIRHLDNPEKFEKYRALLSKINSIGVSHTSNYESSSELGILSMNVSQAADKTFAKAICEFGSKLQTVDDVSRKKLKRNSDGGEIRFDKLADKMRTEIAAKHKTHRLEIESLKPGVIAYLRENQISNISSSMIPDLVKAIVLKFFSSEKMEAYEIEMFSRYYPHIGSMLFRNFIGKSVSQIKGFTPCSKDGIDNRITLHLGMDVDRILVSDDKPSHLDPLKAIGKPYYDHLNQLLGYKRPIEERKLVMSLDELRRLEIQK